MQERSDLPYREEVYQIIGCAMSVLNEVGAGYNEKIYENGLVVAFQKKGILYSQQSRHKVLYIDTPAGPLSQISLRSI